MGDKKSIDFNVDNSHWIYILQDTADYNGIEVSKQYILHSNEDQLNKDSYINGNINSFIDSNEIAMQLRRT